MNKKKDIEKTQKLSKEQEKTIASLIESRLSLIKKYNDETKRDDALKDIVYVKFCASLVNFHYLIRQMLRELAKTNEDVMCDMFANYVLIQNFALPGLPELEAFFHQRASKELERKGEKILKKEKKDEK